MSAKPKLAIALSIDTFIHDIEAHLSQEYDVRIFYTTTTQEMEKAIIWADVIWFEFCNDLFIAAINKNLANFGKKVICRWHRFEITDTPYAENLNWDYVDDLILVSHDMKRVMLEKVPDLESKTRVSVVENGLDFSKFSISEQLDPYKIAWVAKPILRKNPMMAIQVLNKLVEKDERYTLHFAGGFDQRIVQPHLEHIAKNLDLMDHIVFNEWIEDMPAFYADKGVILSTSIHESFGYNIVEGMAIGAIPAVYDYVGSAEFWPDDIRFSSVDQAVDVITGQELYKWRDYAIEHFSLEKQMSKLDAVMSSYKA